MRIQPSLPSLLLGTAILSTLTSASGFDCKHINSDGYKYDLSPLGGVHLLYNFKEDESQTVNTTYVLNICNILKGSANRGGLKCGTSKNICGFEYTTPADGRTGSSRVFPIVGLDPMGHGTKDPQVTRLKKLDSDSEGLMVKLSGGEYAEADKKEQKPKDAGAVIDFRCDPDRTGLEGLRNESKRDAQETSAFSTRDEDSSLQFVSFGQGDDSSYVLKLDWRTRYACDNYLKDNKGKDKSGDDGNSWGFFTWFIIILFLCTAAYLIFGSWLNYNRYGARGWDLLPHGDTIRDIPYILQDWFRRVVNTLQGTDSRGGYSAV